MIQGFKIVSHWVSEFLVKMGIDSIVQDFGLSVREVSDGLVFFFAGFFVGYLSKKCFKFVFIGGIALFVLFKLLELKGVVVIDWSFLHESLGRVGVQPAQWREIIASWFELMKNNVFLSIMGIGGVYLGLSVA